MLAEDHAVPCRYDLGHEGPHSWEVNDPSLPPLDPPPRNLTEELRRVRSHIEAGVQLIESGDENAAPVALRDAISLLDHEVAAAVAGQDQPALIAQLESLLQKEREGRERPVVRIESPQGKHPVNDDPLHEVVIEGPGGDYCWGLYPDIAVAEAEVYNVTRLMEIVWW